MEYKNNNCAKTCNVGHNKYSNTCNNQNIHSNVSNHHPYPWHHIFLPSSHCNIMDSMSSPKRMCIAHKINPLATTTGLHHIIFNPCKQSKKLLKRIRRPNKQTVTKTSDISKQIKSKKNESKTNYIK